MIEPRPSRMTRREMAGMVLAGTAASQAPPEATGQTAAPDGELESARSRNKRAADALSGVKLPVVADPAFHFTP